MSVISDRGKLYSIYVGVRLSVRLNVSVGLFNHFYFDPELSESWERDGELLKNN